MRGGQRTQTKLCGCSVGFCLQMSQISEREYVFDVRQPMENIRIYFRIIN